MVNVVLLDESSHEFRTKCCTPVDDESDGKEFPKFDKLTPYLRELALNNSEFCRNSRCYNNRLAFGATGIDNDSGMFFQRSFFQNNLYENNFYFMRFSQCFKVVALKREVLYLL